MPTFELQIHGTPPTEDFAETFAARLTQDFETGPPAEARPCHPGSRIEVQLWPDFDKPRAVGSLCCMVCGEAFSRIDWDSQVGHSGAMIYTSACDVMDMPGQDVPGGRPIVRLVHR